MADFYPELIKAEAVKAVEAYINGKVPLSDTIAFVADQRGLNSDQIKRLIEATNQICYLKLQTMTEDRTFEFPLADYNEVMSKILALAPTMDKQASVGPIKQSPLDIVTGKQPEMTKEASEGHRDATASEMFKEASDQHKAILTYRTIQRECHRLEKMASDSDIMVESLFSATNKAKKDPEFLDKLASVADEKVYFSLAKFAGMAPEEGNRDQIFRKNDLAEVEGLCSMYKEAQELVAAKQDLSAKLEKAAAHLDGMLEKEAMIGLAAKGISKAIGMVGNPVAAAAGATGKAAGKGVFKAGKKVVSSPVAGAGAFGAIDYATNPTNVKIKNRV